MALLDGALRLKVIKPYLLLGANVPGKLHLAVLRG